MRILHVVPTYIPAWRYGGPIYSVHGLCRGLAGRGHEVHVFTTNVDGPGDSDVPLGEVVLLDGVKVWYYSSKRGRRLYWSPPLRRALQARIHEFDVVHLHSVFLWPTLAAARLARRFGVPYLLAPRGMLVKDLFQRKSGLLKSLWLALFERKTIQQAAALHLTSDVEALEIQKFNLDPPPLFNVPNGVDMPENPPFDAAARKNVLFLSRVHWKKGLDRLIPAMRYVPDAELLIAGNDEENYRPLLEDLAARHQVTERIRFLGAVAGDEKHALLNQAALLVLPSYSENFGNVVLEAMAHRCPVIVTPEVGLAEVVRDSGAGMVCVGEPESLGAALADLLAREDLRRDMGLKGEQRVREAFTWDAVAAQMERVYQDITGHTEQT